MKKQHWGQHLTAGRHGKPKELTQGDCGSWRKVAAACRRMTHSTRVEDAGDMIARDMTRTMFYKNPEGTDVREETFKGIDCNSGIGDRLLKQQIQGSKRMKDLGGRRPLCLRKERTTTNHIRGWSLGQRSHLGSGGMLKKILYEILRGKIAKQVVGASSG
jgi:hypothetical protein